MLRNSLYLLESAGVRVAYHPVVFALVAASLLLAAPGSGAAQTNAPPSGLLAVVGRQVAWLNLEAPRHRPVSHFPSASNALALAEPAMLPADDHTPSAGS